MTVERESSEILIVDDDVVTRRMLRSVLEAEGYLVIEAIDGAEALKLLDERPVPIVISDWVMPVLDGLELLDRLRQREQYTYVIMLTSHDGELPGIRDAERGVDDFLLKPFQPMNLISRVRVARRIMALHRDLEQRNIRLETLYGEIQSDLEEAATVQRMLLPRPDLELLGFESAWKLHASSGVGGDLLGLIELDRDRLFAWVLDVAGHGVASALLATRIKMLLQAAVDRQQSREIDLASILEYINTKIAGTVRRSRPPLATLVLTLVDLERGKLDWASAGHPPPLLLEEDKVEILAGSSCLLGALDEPNFEVWERDLPASGRLALYSDGLSETVGCNELVDRRLGELMAAGRDDQLDQLVNRVFTASLGWTSPWDIDDDRTLLMLEWPSR